MNKKTIQDTNLNRQKIRWTIKMSRIINFNAISNEHSNIIVASVQKKKLIKSLKVEFLFILYLPLS